MQYDTEDYQALVDSWKAAEASRESTKDGVVSDCLWGASVRKTILRIVTDGTYCGTKIYDDASGVLRTYFTGDETFEGTVAHNTDGALAMFDVRWWVWLEEETDKAASLPVTLRIPCEEQTDFSWSELLGRRPRD